MKYDEYFMFNEPNIQSLYVINNIDNSIIKNIFKNINNIELYYNVFNPF